MGRMKDVDTNLPTVAQEPEIAGGRDNFVRASRFRCCVRPETSLTTICAHISTNTLSRTQVGQDTLTHQQ